MCLAPYDVELRAAGTSLRINVVALARCRKCAAFVVKLRIEYFGGQGITRSSLSELLAFGSVSRVGVAALNHEAFDGAVE